MTAALIRRGLLALVFATAALSFGASAKPALAAPVTVTNCADSGNGSLRDAVTNASSGDTIVFDQDCTGPSAIVLSSAISISGTTLTIDGTSDAVTISGNDSTRIFTIQSSATLTLSGLTLTHGRSTFGGAIRNDGTLNIQKTTLANNSSADHAGAVLNIGTLAIENSTFEGNSSAANGGAIANLGTLTVGTSTFVENAAGTGPCCAAGGAIENEGTLTVDRSTFARNSASGHGGAIYGDLVLRNSTVSGNESLFGGGITTYYGTSMLQDDTISDNTATQGGSQIFVFASTVHVANTIVGGTSVDNCGGDPLTDDGNNLQFGDVSCGFSLTGDPLLGALAPNGGPTQTRALGEGSPALGAGNATVCQSAGVGNVDQRGQPRRAGTRGSCDIGAYDTGTGAPSAAKTTIGRNPTKIVADGLSTSTITVTAKDTSGNRIRIGGATVTLSTNLGSLSAVTDKHDGTYTATLTSGTVRGTAKITGTINGSAITATVGVDFVAGPPVGTTSVITRTPKQIAVGGSTATVTVQAKDQYGNVIKVGGATVTLDTTLGSIGLVADKGNGTYSATLTSGNSAGTATISGTIGGSAITSTTGVAFVAGPPSGSTTTINRSRSTIAADGVSTSVITVRAYDQYGNVIKIGGANVTLQTDRGSLTSVTDAGGGKYTATLSSSTSPGTATITGTINSQPIAASTTVVFT